MHGLAAKKVGHRADLPFPPDQWRRLAREVVRAAPERSERGKLGRQVWMDELEHSLRLQEIAQAVFAEIPQRGLWGERSASQLLDRLREEDLLPVPGGEEPRQSIQRRGEVIASGIRKSFSCMHRHAHS